MSEHANSSRLYLSIWGWLAGLMLLGVFLSEVPILPIPRWGIVLIVLLLSSIKAVLVALYYMHLKMERWFLPIVAAAPLFLITLAVGVVLSSKLIHF